MPKGSINDQKTWGNNTEWKYKDNIWSIKNYWNGWNGFHVFTNFKIQNNIYRCDNCFDEKSSFTDYIKDYPSIIINHLLYKINQLEIENLKLKLVEKENEIKALKYENNYITQIKKYVIQALKNDNKDFINKIKLLEDNSNNSINCNNVPNNDKKIISSMELKIENNKNIDLKEINLGYAFNLKKGNF